MIVQIIIVRNAVNRKNIKYDCLTPPKTFNLCEPRLQLFTKIGFNLVSSN